MKRILTLMLSVLCYNSCISQASRVQKAQAFFTMSVPGIQHVDDQGNRVAAEPIIERFIYLECKSKTKPIIDSVWYNNTLFIATVADEEEKASGVGIKYDNGQPALLNTKKGNHTWKVELVQAGNKTLPHASVKKILIKGKVDQVKFNYTITTEIQLSTPDRP